jgi:hypothetical protein
MHVTRSGNSYNISNNQNPNTDIPQLQAQITQLTSVLEQINHRIDVTDERRAQDEFGLHNRRVCGPPLENEINGSEGTKMMKNTRRGTRDLVIVELILSEMAMNFPGDKKGVTSTITLLMN